MLNNICYSFAIYQKIKSFQQPHEIIEMFSSLKKHKWLNFSVNLHSQNHLSSSETFIYDHKDQLKTIVLFTINVIRGIPYKSKFKHSQYTTVSFLEYRVKINWNVLIPEKVHKKDMKTV